MKRESTKIRWKKPSRSTVFIWIKGTCISPAILSQKRVNLGLIARKEETKNNGTGEVDTTQDDKKSRIITIPYIAGMSEDIRRICRRFDIKVAFKSGQTLRSQLSRVKDRLPTMMIVCGVQDTLHMW